MYSAAHILSERLGPICGLVLFGVAAAMLTLCSASYAETQVTLSGTQILAPLTPDENGRFAFQNVPLRKNSVNTFTVTAKDDSGNSVSKDINITQLSLENVVVSQVTTERLSQQRIEQLVNDGVINIDDPSNFNVSRFQIVLTIGTESVPIDVPILMPKTEEIGFETIQFQRCDCGGGGGNPPPPADTIIVFEQPVAAAPGQPQPPPIPGVILIQGDIKTLKEFFSVRLLLMNASGIFTLQDVKAKISYPDGGLSSTLPVDSIADFGDILPGDAGQPGQAEKEFIVRGDEIGKRGVRIEFGGTVGGPGIAEDEAIPFNGAATAQLEVLGPPNFLVQVQHPPAVVRNVPYQLTIDITNSGLLPALYASLKLDVGGAAQLMNCTVDPVTGEPVCEPQEGSSIRSLGHIQPGETVREVYTINPLQSGPISSCFGVSDQNIELQVGVGNIGCLTGHRPTPSAAQDGTPTVNVVPSANALGVGIDSPVVAFFSEKMNTSTISIGEGGTFRVSDGDGAYPPGVLNLIELGDATVAIWQLKDNITNRLSPDTQYTVTVTQGIKDLDGNALSNELITQFTTTNPLADTDPPQASLSVLPPVDPNFVLPGQIVRLNAYAADQGTGIGRLELRVRDTGVPDSAFEMIDQKTVFDVTPFPLVFAIDSAKLDLGHTYIYKLTAYDKLANAQDATVAVIVAPNADPPTIALPDDPPDSVLRGISVKLNPASVSAGVRDVYYFLDGNSAAFSRVTLPPFQTVLPTLGLGVGDHVLRAVAVDGLGQTGEDNYAFKIAENKNPPQARIVGAADGTQFPTGAVFSVSADVQDPVGVAFIGYHLDDAAGPIFAIGSDPVSVDTSGLSLGAHRIVLHVINKLGITSDLTDPEAILDFSVVEPPQGQPPAAPVITHVSLPQDGKSTVEGTSAPGSQIAMTNVTLGITLQSVADGSGHFSLVIDAQGGNELSAVAYLLTQSIEPSATTLASVPVPAELSNIEVSPPSLHFTSAGGTSSLTATAHFADNSTQDVTSQATYTSDAPGVASVGANGQVVAQGNGQATITASFGGKQGSATVDVAAVTLTSISVDPTTVTLAAIGATKALAVTGHYSDSSTQPISNATFSTDNPLIATVNASGVVNAKANGSAFITVSVGNLPPVIVGVTVNVDLDQAPTIQILSPPDGTQVERNQSVTLSVRATDDLGVQQIQFGATGATTASETRQVSPPSTDTTQDFSFTVSNTAPVGGAITLTVQAQDTGDHQSAPATITLNVVDTTAPAASIVSPTNGTVVHFGDTVTVNVNASDLVGVSEIRYNTTGALDFSGTKTVDPATPSASASFTFKVPFNTLNPDATIHAFAKDASGNEGTAVTVPIIISDADIVPPATHITSVSNPGSGATAIVSYTVTDGVDDLDHVELYFRRNGIGTFNRFTDSAGGNPEGKFTPQSGANGTMVFDSTKMGGDGAFEFYTVGVDKAGNRESAPLDGGNMPTADAGGTAAFNTGVAVTLINTNQEIGDNSLENKNLRISGATLTLVGTHAFKNVELLNGAVLTHRPTTLAEEPGLSFSAWTITVDGTSAIDVDGLGYLAGRSGANGGDYTGRTLNNDPGATYRSGASYGGPGASFGGTTNAIYGSLVDPVDLGSGGSGGGAGNAGGQGGGRIGIQAINIANDGAISADGAEGTGYQAGSGSGGSIKLAVSTISGAGQVRANGGGFEVGGGGGRVAVFYVDDSTLDPVSVQALGGQGAYGVAGNGTVFLKGLAEGNGTLVFDGQGASTTFSTLPIPPGFVFDSIVLRNNARVIADDPIAVNDSLEVLSGSILTHSVSHEEGLNIQAGRVFVDSTSRIDVTGNGYRAGRSPGNPGDYTGRTLGDLPGAAYRSGGSYGGYGGVFDGAGSNAPYGVAANPVYLGSGGTGGAAGNAGGNGGGRITIQATKEVQVEGQILANGGDGTGYQAGGGSGGSIHITTSFLRGTGTVAANGGGNEVGGGGGRVALFYDAVGINGEDFGGLLNISAFGGHGANRWGGAGTVLLRRSDQALGDLYVDDNVVSGTTQVWTPLTPIGYGESLALTADTLTVDGNVVFTPNGLVDIEVNPNLNQSKTFRIVANTANTLTVDISGGTSLTDVATAGDGYNGIHRFDNVFFRRGGYLVLGDQLVVSGTLTLDENGRLDHYDATTTFEPRLDLTVGHLIVAAIGSINVDGRGYLAGRHLLNIGPYTGRTLDNALGSAYRSGGSYGGLGARYDGVPSDIYGNVTDPSALGSGGSGGAAGNGGGDGGGWVALHANSIEVDGIISANGEDGTGYQAGSGSGGTVNIRTNTLSGSGTIRVNGGGFEVGGGGGRIGVVYNTLDIDSSQLLAFGGVGINSVAGNGTICLRQQTQTLGDLLVDGSNAATPSDTTPIPPGVTFHNVTLRNNARVVADVPLVVAQDLKILTGSVLTHRAGLDTGLTIQAHNLLVDGTSSIDVTGRGYTAGRSAANPGLYEGVTLGGVLGATYRSGGSYGGYGGQYGGITNPPYGDPSEPIYLGSGGSGGGGGNAGGAGGGLITIQVDGVVTIDGTVLANGGGGTGFQAGSGSGGSIRITAATVQGQGAIAADGGVAEVGGGGGRVAIYYNALGGAGHNLNGLLNIHAFGGHGGNAQGSAGTVLLRQTAQARGDLYLDDNMSGATAPNWTPLTRIGYGKSATLTDTVLTTDGNVPMIPNGLVGLTLNPNLSQNQTFRIVANTAGAITVAVVNNVKLTDVAAPGDPYAAVYRFDNIYFRRGGYLVLGDNLAVTGTLSVDDYGRIEHYDATMTYEAHLDITADTFDLAATGVIAADGRGYLAGRHLPNGSVYEGRTLNNATGSTYRSGGSYGGLGAPYQGGIPNPVYGSATDPAALGSGGSGGAANNAGGDGGGWVLLRANAAVLDGLISTNGEAGTGFQAGGGSGGTVNIQAPNISGTGTIHADGGGNEVGGGGGRIALTYDAVLSNVNALQTTAQGGLGNSAAGQDGTIVPTTKNASQFEPIEAETDGVYGDISGDGTVNAVDVQRVINAALGSSAYPNADVNRDGHTNALDVQVVINLALSR